MALRCTRLSGGGAHAALCCFFFLTRLHAKFESCLVTMPVNNMPARTYDHKYSAPRSARSSGDLAYKLACDDDKENGAAKGQALSPSKIIKGVRGRAVGTPTSHSVEWPLAARGHSSGGLGSSNGHADPEFTNSLDSLAGISNIQVLPTWHRVLLFCHSLYRTCRLIFSRRSWLFAKRYN